MSECAAALTPSVPAAYGGVSFLHHLTQALTLSRPRLARLSVPLSTVYMEGLMFAYQEMMGCVRND